MRPGPNRSSAGRPPGCFRSTRKGACCCCTAGIRTIPITPSGSPSAARPRTGESLRDAAARELYEETRISVDPEHLGEPIAQNTIEFSWGGHRILQDQTFYAVLVTSAEVSLDGLDQWEQATTDTYGWLAPGDLGADERPAHPDIPDLIRAAAASVRYR